MAVQAGAATTLAGSRSRNRLLKTALQLGWALWSTVVLCTNVLDAFQAAGVLPRWKLPEGNFEGIHSATALYHVPLSIDWVLFLGVILWDMLIVVLFWRSVGAVWRDGGRNNLAVQRAYLASLPIWLALMVACEIFLDWSGEPELVALLAAQGVTMLILSLLPDSDEVIALRA